MRILPNTDKIEVRLSRKINERGVFAKVDIKESETIEVCPLLRIPIKDMEFIDKTRLQYYYFDLTKKYFAIVLGYGSLYNHSYTPNAKYDLSALKRIMKVTAIKNINKGEEIFFNYNGDPDIKTPLSLWFDPNFKDKSK